MAEMNSSNSQSGATRSKGRSRSRGHIDMTAMVDVAFLLLTFFVLTSVLHKDYVMEMTSPPADEKGVPVYTDKDEKEIMTIVLDSADRIQYYVGMTEAEAKSCDYIEIRPIIQRFLRQNSPLCHDVKGINGEEPEGCWDPYFLIKAKATSSFGNLIDILDEMAIADAPKYTLDKLNDADFEILAGK